PTKNIPRTLHDALPIYGQGKTNLLEAIYWTTQGNPFRPGKSIDFIDKRDSQGFARIETEIQHGHLRSSVEVLIQASRKKIELNKDRKSTRLNSSHVKIS